MSTLLQKLAGHLRIIHAHDNDGRSDTHLWPASGTERPASLSCGTIDWPAIYALAATLPPDTPGVLEVADAQAWWPDLVGMYESAQRQGWLIVCEEP